MDKDYAESSAAAQLDNLGYQLVSIDDYIKMYDGRMENSSESVFETQLVYGFKAYWSDEMEKLKLNEHVPENFGSIFRSRKLIHMI